MMINAYTVQDPVNKYRHGVLIGNFVEDKFGKDLHEKVLLLSSRVHCLMHQNNQRQRIITILTTPSIKRISLLIAKNQTSLISMKHLRALKINL
jgi:hypothetical protein